MNVAILLCFLHILLKAMADVCPSQSWYSYQTDCFLFVSDTVNWTTARELCTVQHAHLVRNDNSSMDVFLREAMKAEDIRYVWTGANDIETEGSFVWENNGDLVTYTDWEKNNPNDYNGQDCVRFGASKSWNDLGCEVLYSYACQAKHAINQNTVTSSATTGESSSHVSDDAKETTTSDDVEHSSSSDDVGHTTTTDDVEHTSSSDNVAHTTTTDDEEHTSPSDGVGQTTTTDDVEHTSSSDDVVNTTTSDTIEQSTGSAEMVNNSTEQNDVNKTTDSDELYQTTYSDNLEHTSYSGDVERTTNSISEEHTSTPNEVADTIGSVSTLSSIENFAESDDKERTVSCGQDNNTDSDDEHSTVAPSGSVCTCCITYNDAHLTSEQKQQIIKQLREELFIPKENLSAHRRKLISVNDSRSSSVTMGSLGCVMLSLILGSMVMLDMISLCRFLCGMASRKMA